MVSAGEGEQLSIYTDLERREKSEKISRAMDDINRRFGKGTVRHLGELGDNE